MIVVRAPFRISIAGGGTDLPSYYGRFGGLILSAAINKYVYINLNRPAADDLIRVKYSQYEQVSTPDEIQHDLVRPALKLLGFDKNIEISSMADLPAGTGLGSSSTYLVAVLVGLHALRRSSLTTQELAEQAIDIEMNRAGHPVGKQDHYLAAFGGVTRLDIENDGAVRVSKPRINQTTLDDFRSNVLLFYTGVTRRSTIILEQQKRDSTSGDSSVLDSLHRTKELGARIVSVLEAGDVESFGRLLDEHWQNKKKRSEAITVLRLDEWYQIAREHGSPGGKIMGAGGGGFFMFYVPPPRKAALRTALTSAGLRELPYDFDHEGAKVIANF